MKNLMKKLNKENTKSVLQKMNMAILGFVLAFTPGLVSASSPSSLINRGTNALMNEGKAVVPGLAGVVVIVAVIMYMLSSDHGKRFWKGTAITAFIVAVLVFAAPGLISWFRGVTGV